MNIKHTLLVGIALASATVVSSQTVTLSPSPQSIEWGAKAFNRPESVTTRGASTADGDAVATLLRSFPEAKRGVKVTIGERGDKAVKSVESRIPNHPEG